MNKKFSRITEPSMRLYFIVLVIFAIASVFFEWRLAVAEIAIVVVLFAYSRVSAVRRRREIIKYMESVSYELDKTTKEALTHFPLPTVMFRISDGEVLWSNEDFLRITGDREHVFETRLKDILPGFSAKWLLEGRNECPQLVELRGRRYRVYGSVARSENGDENGGLVCTTYWMDITELAEVKDEYENSRPVTAILMIDNYEELFKTATDAQKSAVLAQIDERINAWSSPCGGLLCKYDRDRYAFVFESRYLKEFVAEKFSLLDSVREIKGAGGIPATLSIGVGRDGADMAEDYAFATLAIEMALSRGGDQAVVKNKLGFEFYGGHSMEMERRTKVKSRVMANAFVKLISDASAVYVMGHKQADLDSVGAAVGVCCLARKLGKKAKIVVDPETTVAGQLIKNMMKAPEYADAFMTPQDAIVEIDGKSVLVIVDTNRPEQTDSPDLLSSCNKIVIIDHHRRAATHIDNATLNFHEPYASSASELVVELLQYQIDKNDILRCEAEALLAGIMLDTKNFTLRTGGSTFEAAAFLRRAGADTTEVKILLQSDLGSTIEKYSIIQNAKEYGRGTVLALRDEPVDRTVAAQAADELLNIYGISASFVVFAIDEHTTGISARSIGDLNVQMVLERLGGGGNKSTAGAQIADKTPSQVLPDLLASIDFCTSAPAEDNQ